MVSSGRTEISCLQNECFGVLQENTGEGVRASLSRFFSPFSDTDLMF